ncbi:hypothetical protein B0J17DRAFT_626058 [Rhizoctonia solani]|nr:hypothetical protein B0J17DRAFT_626058 [Rhizoctonia solani]
MGFIAIALIASIGLLRTPHTLVNINPKPADALVRQDRVSALTESTAGQLMLPEDIIFYEHLILVALTIAGLYSFILGHEKPPRTRSIPPLSRETHDYYSTTQIKDRFTPESIRLDSRVRGPSKPAVQIPATPTYLEKLAHSPTEERTSHVFGASTNTSTQNTEVRGRMDAVTKSTTADCSAPVSSTQSTTPKYRVGRTTTRSSLRKKPYTRRAHTAPFATTVKYAPHPPEPENALLGSLKGLQLRPDTPTQSTLVHILGVGLSWIGIDKGFEPLRGPAHDFWWLKKLFVDQKQVHFTSLLDNEVSFDTIHHSVTHMYSNAQPNDCLVLYFTGHGDDNNAFKFYDDDPGSLGEVILNDWIVELRRKTSKRIPVYIIFDFCRENPARSDARLDDDVTVIWSCPPGQKSPDLGLSGELPYSCFLLALFLAIDDGSKCHGSPDVQYFARRLVELLNVIWGIRSFRLGSWRRKRWCRHPNSCEICRDKRHNSRDGIRWPDPQLFEILADMYLGELPDFSAIMRFASTRLSLPIRNIRETLEGSQWFMYFNPSRIDTNKGSLTPGVRRFWSREVQGIIESAVQARGSTLPLGALPAVPIPIAK